MSKQSDISGRKMPESFVREAFEAGMRVVHRASMRRFLEWEELPESSREGYRAIVEFVAAKAPSVQDGNEKQ